MDLWQASNIDAGHTRETARASRVLTSISGNVQAFPPDTKHHLLFNKVLPHGTRAVSESRFPRPVTTLGSNDKQEVSDRLAARKARRGSHSSSRRVHERPYLNNEKYKTYRGRGRQDVGKDGMPVWPDFIEESFQDALVNIPPMGRKKRPQHGKQFGRNELISEWIYQDTGVRRQRKQVSSHIQVLTGYLKDEPGWQVLVTADDSHQPENEQPFYLESIADQVRIWRQLSKEAKLEAEGGDDWFDISQQRYNTSRVYFDMWIGRSDNVSNALHAYTTLPKNQKAEPSIPLENHKNWREQFPDLENIMKSSGNARYDIIKLKSRLSLMSDLPPAGSKLGLVLTMDFRNPEDNLRMLSQLKHWSYTNSTYLYGKLTRRTEHKWNQSAEVGVASLAFEADWWAAQFAELAHKRREVGDGQNEAEVTDLDEYSRNRFRGLTVMQEIFATSTQDTSTTRKRMAVLLWTFSQIGGGQKGSTTWQKVMAPPSREETNSPFPSGIETSPPPLALDSMVNNLDIEMTEDDFLYHDAEADMSCPPPVYEMSSYHSGFTPLHSMSNDQLKIFDLTTSTGFTPRPAPSFSTNNTKYEPFDFNAPIQPVLSYTSHHRMPTNTHNNLLSVFDMSAYTTLDTMSHSLSMQQQRQQQNQILYQNPGFQVMYTPDRRGSLANFDMSTHQMLQVQLGEVDDSYASASVAVPTPTKSESQQSVIGHIHDLDLHEDHTGLVQIQEQSDVRDDETLNNDTNEEERNNENIPYDISAAVTQHPAAFTSPRIIRPPLLPHNSFAGVLDSHSYAHNKTVDEPEQLAFDTPTRDDFARLISHHDNSGLDDLFGDHINPLLDHYSLQADFSRPRSQPVFPSNDAGGPGMVTTRQVLNERLPAIKTEAL